MKKQRWKFTKQYLYCLDCGKKLDVRNLYHYRFQTCDANCFGLIRI
ncbi:hypothetical protein PQE72_gp064 [Bacillus phage vB_BanS_Skywalker]|uniref:Uncharacterized protein n=1 Tax=Bacillus phage vB_BanS_Skywalker TaxID=2894789 RepID=A0AAE8YYQ4_9CAUD|nr:hypothetical protein PQE72_gp064 [Bacillus phage vB_BanS_Skywalker]UGO51379.1 hypothetical protein SKYWALKER_222 [Bacillus phage vB_BanS_Skywalker]